MTALTVPLPADPPRWWWWPHVRAAAVWLVSLRHLSLLAVLAWTAHAHWSLALLLGAPWWLAVCLPIAIDCYVLSALRAWEVAPARRHLDLVWALGLDAVAVSGAHAAHQVALPPRWLAAIAALLGVVLVLVLWRVHALDVEVRARAPRQRPTPLAPPAPPAVAAADAMHSGGGVAEVTAMAARQVASPGGGDVRRERRELAVALREAGMARRDGVARIMAETACSRRTAERAWDGR